MTKPHSTLRTKPAKPHPDFPLFPHGSGQWARKIRGKLFYFGSWKDPDSALNYYLEVKDDLLLGRKPRPRGSDELTVENLCNLFLVSRERKVETGDLERRTFEEYKTEAKRVAAEFGKTTIVEELRPEDFAEFRAKLGRGVNPKTLEGRIARVRAIFNYADKNGLLERPLSKIWGTEFAKPSRKTLKIIRRENPRSLTAPEIWQLLEAAGAHTAAMIWLGINCGFGNKDVARIKLSDLDFAGGWLRLYRSKTGIDRRCPLWPETIKALKEAIKVRPAPKSPEDSDLVFITKYGQSWIPKPRSNPLTHELKKLREEAKITGKGKTFYALRHMFQTIGDETKNYVAVSSIMGHADGSISGHYREQVSDEALLEVSNHVRDWLLAGKPSKKGGKR
jgi:integrase